MKDSKVVQSIQMKKYSSYTSKYINNNRFSIKSNISLLFTKNYKFERFRDKNKQNSTFGCLGRQQTIKQFFQFYVFVLFIL